MARTEAVQGDACVVDDEVYTPAVRACQMLGQRTHTGAICDVQGVELDVCEAAVGCQGGGLGELGVVLEVLEGCFAAGLVAGCEVLREMSV